MSCATKPVIMALIGAAFSNEQHLAKLHHIRTVQVSWVCTSV